ncbi:MAG TPA: hypothetical protein VGN26_10870 [Armatimonadota bacterium]
MSQDQPSDPFFHLEARTIDELIEGLQRLDIDPDDLKVESPKKKQQPKPQFDPGEPRNATPDLIREVADSIPDPALSPAAPELPDVPLVGEHGRAVSAPALPKGAALKRFRRRQQRLLEREAAYVHLSEAIHAKDAGDRQAAVQALEELGEDQKLARVAQWCVHLMTRRQAVEALVRRCAVLALEDVALFTRPPEPPQGRAEPTATAESPAHRKAADDGFDEVQNLAVDKIAELVDRGEPGAMDALQRLARYDFSKHGYSQFHAIRRLGERAASLVQARDVDGLVLAFNLTKNPNTRQSILAFFAGNLEWLHEEEHLDALHLLLEFEPALAQEAEALILRLES